MPIRPFSFGGTPRSPGAAVFVSSCPHSNNNLSKSVKTSSALIKKAEIAIGNTTSRFFDLDVTLTDETIACLNVDKDTVRVNTHKDGSWKDAYTLATKDDFLISVSGSGPTDWNALETTENMPFRMWNVGKASRFKGAPAGCYDYGTLIALVATTSGDRWRNTLIYLPDSNNGDGKIYIRSAKATKWLAFSGTQVDSVS